MHRLLVDSALLAEESPVLPASAARHLRVVRPKPGEQVELFDGHGKWRIYRFRASPKSGEDASSSLAATSQTFQTSPTSKPLTLFACVTKGARWDWTIEKATELGVAHIVPVISDRTIVRIPQGERAAKRERWMRVAADAARQSDAKWLPEIAEPVDFSDSLELVKGTDCLIGALTDPPSPSISTARGNAVFIGPEGDFTPAELARLMEVAKPVSFGPTILRAETAAIFALSVLSVLPFAREF